MKKLTLKLIAIMLGAILLFGTTGCGLKKQEKVEVSTLMQNAVERLLEEEYFNLEVKLTSREKFEMWQQYILNPAETVSDTSVYIKNTQGYIDLITKTKLTEKYMENMETGDTTVTKEEVANTGYYKIGKETVESGS